MTRARAVDNRPPIASSLGAVLVPLALASALLSTCASPGFLVVGHGLALCDEKFGKLASREMGERVEYALSPNRKAIAAAWVDTEGRSLLQIFSAKDLSPVSAETPIAPYATVTIGFWHPMIWMSESTLVVEFVTTPRPSPDQGFDSFYAQVFQLPPQPDRPLALHPDHPPRIELPADNTHLLAVVDGTAIVLNEALALRRVNLRTGAAGPAIEVRPRGQDGILEAPMGWCAKDDSTLLLFGFDGSVREIRIRPELEILRKIALPDLPAGAHVAIGEVELDPFRPERVLIGLGYLDKSGPIEVRATDGLKLLDSADRESGWAFAAAASGSILSWNFDTRAAVRIRGPSGTSELRFDGAIGAIVPLR